MENDQSELKKSYNLAKEFQQELSTLPNDSPLEVAYHAALSIIWNFKDVGLKSALPYINTALTHYQLTLLHTAVIHGRRDVILDLLDLGADINAQDFRLWSPLHHAALSGRKDILDLLLSRGADPSLKNVFESPFEDILRLKELVELKSEDPIPVFFEEAGKGEHQMTAGEYLSVTGCHYIYENNFTSLRLLQMWKEGPQQVLLPGLCEIFHRKHQEFLNNTPLLSLKPVLNDSSGNLLPVSPGLGVFARSTYKPMDIIGEYLGLYQVKYENPSPYFVKEGPEAIKYGNEISRINDGFPNATMIRLPKYRGVPYRRFLVALDKISPGEQIIWNYGYGKMKLDPLVELRPSETREFIKNHSIESLLKTLDLTQRTEDLDFSYYPKIEKLRYLLATPSIIFILILEELLTSQQGLLLVKTSINLGIMPSELEMWLNEVIKIAQNGANLSKRLSQSNKQVAKEFVKCITTLPAYVTFANALRIAIVPIESMHFELDSLEGGPHVLSTAEQEAIVRNIWEKWKQSIQRQVNTDLA